METQSPLTTHPLLSADILPSIFIQLPADQILCVISLVCRQWARVSRLDSLWKGLLARSTGLKEDAEPIIVAPGIHRTDNSASDVTLGSSGSLSDASSSLDALSLNIGHSSTRQTQQRHSQTHHIPWFRFALESRLARILLGLTRHPSARSPAQQFPRLSRTRDPLLWSLFPGRLYYTGLFEQWDPNVLVDVEPNGALGIPAALVAAQNILSANPVFPTIQPPVVHNYRGDLLITNFYGRRFEGVILYPSANRRDTPPSITRVQGEISSSSSLHRRIAHAGESDIDAGDEEGSYRGRIRLRELELVRARGPAAIFIPTGSYVLYDSLARYTDIPSPSFEDSDGQSDSGPEHGYATQPSNTSPPNPQASIVDQTISFAADLPVIQTSPSSIELGQPFRERFGVAWEVDWAGERGVGRVEFVLAK